MNGVDFTVANEKHLNITDMPDVSSMDNDALSEFQAALNNSNTDDNNIVTGQGSVINSSEENKNQLGDAMQLFAASFP